MTLVAVLAMEVKADVSAIHDHVTDAGYVGALPTEEQHLISTYLRAHQDGASYEVAAESATQIGSLIVQDARPVLVLTTYNGRVFTTVAKLEHDDRRRQGPLRLPDDLLHTRRGIGEPRLLGAGAVGARTRHRRLTRGRPRPRQAPLPAAGGAAMSIDGDPRAPGARWPSAARAGGRIALDTEFMGEGRYRTLLCLIQLAVPAEHSAGEAIALIDPLEEHLDGSPLVGRARRPGRAGGRARRPPGHRADPQALQRDR